MHPGLAVLLCGLLAPEADLSSPGAWPQFRGANGDGHAVGAQPLPAEIGPEKNVVWTTPLPEGHSSPVVIGDRIFVTGVRDKSLLTICLNRETGNILWEAEAPYSKLEQVHRIGNRAQPSAASNGDVVVSFFGSSGLLAYDISGKHLWHVPMGPFKNEFGAGSSPILVGDRVLLNQDHDEDSALWCFDKRTGKQLWKVDRSEFPRGYASPVIWTVDGQQQIVVAGTLRVVGYDLASGKEIWTVRGLARVVNMTPVIDEANTLYVAGWAAGGDAEERFALPTFAELMASQDANKNGLFDPDEVPEGPLNTRFAQFDRDKDDHVTRDEYETMRQIFDTAENALLAIKPGGRGDITATHVLWQQKKFLPYIPSPLYHEGHIFMVKDGGIFSSFDASSGKPVKQGRVAGGSSYYSSPVAGDGKIYLLSAKGDLTVVTAQGNWEKVASARFDEETHATPALVDGRIYLRTAGKLFCFSQDAGN
jgi:outer membrane protein assembly factor BamB